MKYQFTFTVPDNIRRIAILTSADGKATCSCIPVHSMRQFVVVGRRIPWAQRITFMLLSNLRLSAFEAIALWCVLLDDEVALFLRS